VSDWFARLPKVELHLHLEGAIPHAALWELVQKYGGDAAVSTPEALAERFRFRNFSHFIEMWVWKNQFLRTYEDFTFIAEAVARDLAQQHIRYSVDSPEVIERLALAVADPQLATDGQALLKGRHRLGPSPLVSVDSPEVVERNTFSAAVSLLLCRFNVRLINCYPITPESTEV
jgi:hypothetical protein